jgi:hypothetical protein
MKTMSLDRVEGEARRSMRDSGLNGAVLTITTLNFVESGQGMEFTMTVQQRLRAGRMFLESLRETLQADVAAAREEARAKALSEERKAVRDEIANEGLEMLRQVLREQIARKYPGHNPVTIDRYLKPLNFEVLKGLGLRLFDELPWADYWSVIKP